MADTQSGVPAVVVDLAFNNEWSALRAWREHLGLTQSEVAAKWASLKPPIPNMKTAAACAQAPAPKLPLP